MTSPEFVVLSSDLRLEILLEKATTYERLTDDVRAIVTGDRPEQMRFRVGGTLCTFTCSDKTFLSGHHNAGTEPECHSCAVYMVRQLVDRLGWAGH